ncbi:MAG: L-iditol 2-dehydrogenase [Candidatus Lokiarchaeota archaeon]|nr:L-iditol 2-dehydrogenase [Candidatus Lokiarchaeota archaeon]
MECNVYYDIGDFRIEKRDFPQIGDNEALIEVKAIGICGTDVHKAMYKTVKPPIVLGHEVSGMVRQVGNKVTKLKIGDRVALAHHAACMTCKYCRKGHHSLCDMYLKNNFEPGGFSSYLKIFQEHIERTAVKIPGTLSYEEAAFMEPLACCLRGWRALKISPMDNVLIIGAGPIGLLFLQIAQMSNVNEIYISDLIEFRLEKAKLLGATNVINISKANLNKKILDFTNNSGVDTIINTVGIDSVYQNSINLLNSGGNYLFFAECVDDSKITFSPNLIYKKELNFVGSYSSSPYDYENGLNLIKNKKINVKELITHMFGLKDLQKGIELAHEAKDSLKIMIIPKL